MLRVTRVDSKEGEVLLKLEGQIVGEWVDLVAKECAASRRSRERVVLDLAGVSYADPSGLSMLRSLDPRSVRLVRLTPVLREQLDDHGDRASRGPSR